MKRNGVQRAPAVQYADPVGTQHLVPGECGEVDSEFMEVDGLVRYRFGDDAELMGAWASARNVLGPFKRKNDPGVPPGQVAAA